VTLRVTGRRVLTVHWPSFPKPRDMLVYTTNLTDVYVGWIAAEYMKPGTRWRSGWYAFKLYGEAPGETLMVVLGEAESDDLPRPPTPLCEQD
jgi:hypothetical protein